MPRSKRRIAWVWPAVAAAGLLAVAAFRLWSNWATRPMAASPRENEAIIGGDPSTSAHARRRIRELRARTARARRRLTDLRARLALTHQQVRTLGAMLTEGDLLRQPPCLRGHADVRALQQIIRQAAGAAQADADRQIRLRTAAAVARERLRAKLADLRDRLRAETAELRDREDRLRQRLRLDEADLRRLRQARAAETADPPASRPSDATGPALPTPRPETPD